ncbi:hypothetical protein CEXT_653771 [Caerostris extrusa]|uniref:Uncharacterized protein n=1 Tax=Caerostris extrusa TaxID=172846 RepID=A0AAV4NFQ6_CAEEX|nr:hypothetical protein CEXT_653771 [Caerostris extrusa]
MLTLSVCRHLYFPRISPPSGGGIARMTNATAGTLGVCETDDSVPFLKDAPQISPPLRIPANQSLRRIFPFPLFPASFPPVISLGIFS